MLRLLKILFFLFLFSILPVVVNAKESEVKYKYYTETINNVHYESDPEDVCEYFEYIDYDDYIYTSSIYSANKPEDKEGRIINVVDSIKVPGENIYVNSLIFSDFYSESYDDDGYFTSLLTEIDIFDKNGNEVYYTKLDEKNITYFDYLNDGLYNKYVFLKKGSGFRAKFDTSYNVHDLTVRFVFKSHAMKSMKAKISGEYREHKNYINGVVDFNDPIENCNGDICYYDFYLTSAIMEDDYDYVASIYEYKDPMYKCYSKERIYVPGYYSSLDGFIRDDDSFIEEEIVNLEELENKIDSLSKENTLLKEENNNLVAKIDALKLDEESFYEMEGSINSLKNENSLLLNSIQYLESENELMLINLSSSLRENDYLKNVLLEMPAETNEEDKEEEVPNEGKTILSYVDTPIKEVKSIKVDIFILVFGILALLLSIFILIRSKKCRTK